MSKDATTLHAFESVPRPTPRAYSIDATAKILNVSASHLWAMIRQGRLRVVKLGRRTLCSSVEIERVLENGL